jgi:hypothetical protein
MKRVKISIIIIGIILWWLQPAYAEHHFKQLSLENISKKIALNESQRKEIQEINERFKEKYYEFYVILKPLNDELKIEKEKEIPDYEKITSILTHIAPYKVELNVLKMQHKKAITKTLSEDQKKELSKAYKNSKRRHKNEDIR